MAGVVVPVTICITFVALKIMGQSFNMMTLGGLAAAGGLVIDDAIVVVENIVLHRDAGEAPLEATSKALKELTIPLIGSTLTPIVVFIPLISITGVTGSFFRALAVAMSVSLLTSLVLALGWTTNLGTFLIRRKHAATSHADDAKEIEDQRQSLVPELTPRESDKKAELAEMRRIMAAEEASLRGGFFERIMKFYEKWMRSALRASCLARRPLRAFDSRFLRLLQAARQRFASRHGRRRIRARLRDACRQFTRRNQPCDHACGENYSSGSGS